MTATRGGGGIPVSVGFFERLAGCYNPHMDGDPTLSQDGEQRLRAQQRSLQAIRPPTQVPGYELEQLLGSGAFGEVW